MACGCSDGIGRVVSRAAVAGSARTAAAALTSASVKALDIPIYTATEAVIPDTSQAVVAQETQKVLALAAEQKPEVKAIVESLPPSFSEAIVPMGTPASKASVSAAEMSFGGAPPPASDNTWKYVAGGVLALGVIAFAMRKGF